MCTAVLQLPKRDAEVMTLPDALDIQLPKPVLAVPSRFGA